MNPHTLCCVDVKAAVPVISGAGVGSVGAGAAAGEGKGAERVAGEFIATFETLTGLGNVVVEVSPGLASTRTVIRGTTAEVSGLVESSAYYKR